LLRELLALLLVGAVVNAAPLAAEGNSDIKVGSLTLTHCIDQYNGYCGTIVQPLDRSGHLPGTITVGFEFYPHTASGPSTGVILAQEGGPGYSTTGSRDGYVRMLDPLRTGRDILLVDKRGTGRSSAIDCPALQKAYLPDASDVAACGKQLGASAWYYRSADAADDVAAVLAALDFAHADYYGDSYGTWFGEVLAVRHPGLLRTIVLDSAYPVLGDNSNSEVNHGQAAMDIVCARSSSCRGFGGSADARFDVLLGALRAHPVTGVAPGASGEPLTVTADPAGLFLVIANAGNAPTTWRDLDAAARALLKQRDPLPLLRLIAEARDSYSGGGSYKSFSVGLADAVQCAEYGANFNQYAPFAQRLSEYRASLAKLRANAPFAFAPFTIDDAVFSQMDAEEFDTCLTWPRPAPGVPPAAPVPAGAKFPSTPVLVFSGELDTVTSPSEGMATARLFPNATFIETTNLVHESAIGDAGYFVPPDGEDLSHCIGPIVRNFIASGGNPGDTSCVPRIRPIRTVPAFVVDYARTAPAIAERGNAAGAKGLVLAAAVSQTVGDAVARYYITESGHESGLRGGGFEVTSTPLGYDLDLHAERWACNLAVSGRVRWNQLSGQIAGDVRFATTDGHSGALSIAWNDLQTEAVASLRGTIDGAHLAASAIAP